MTTAILKIPYGRFFLLLTILFSFSSSYEKYDPYASQKDVMENRTNNFSDRVKNATENQITQRTKQGKKFNEIRDFAEQKNTTFGRIPEDGEQIIKKKKNLSLDAVISGDNVETKPNVETDEQHQSAKEIKDKVEAEIARQNQDAVAEKVIEKTEQTDEQEIKNKPFQSGTIISPF